MPLRPRFLISTGLAVLMAAGTGSIAQAAIVSLNFENIAPVRNNNDVTVGNFYNGGASGIGTSGANLGVSFSSNALVACLNTAGTTCSNASRGGQGDAASQRAGLYFMSGSEAVMNVANGFEDRLSFHYAAAYVAGSVLVYSGLDGTGTLLASLTLGTTMMGCASAYSANFCPFQSAGLSFAGLARSVAFAGVANQVVFDDIALGGFPGTGGSGGSVIQTALIPAVVPTAVPEPASLALFGLGLAGLGMVRARRR